MVNGSLSGVPECSMTDFPLLPYLDDESLEDKIKEVLILRTQIELGKILGKGELLKIIFRFRFLILLINFVPYLLLSSLILSINLETC